jgi:hypothetical protein
VCLGLSLAGIKSPIALAMFTVSGWLFGIMFVTMTWVLEATSYLVKSDSGRYYHLRNRSNEVSKNPAEVVQLGPDVIDLVKKPHVLYLLPFITIYVAGESMRTKEGTDCSKTRYLESRPTLFNPWNLTLLGAASLSVIACNLVSPPLEFNAGDTGILAITIVGFLMLLAMRSTPARWGVLAVVVVFTLVSSVVLSVGYRWAALWASLIFATVYIVFSGSSYNDIVSFNKRVVARVSLAKRAAVRVLIGRATFDSTCSRERNGADSAEEADRKGSSLARGRRDSVE